MSAEEPIPVFTDLATVHGSLGVASEHIERWAALADEFRQRFGHNPSYIARAPGRVNLIGEHIDYALFGVFPAALERDILIACGPCSDAEQSGGHGRVRAENVNAKYEPHTFTPTARTRDDGRKEWHLDIDTSQLHWESYLKAGYLGVLERCFSDKSTTTPPSSVDLLVAGNIPPGAGVSSSAAMVVAGTLAFLAANNVLAGVTKGALVDMAMRNERRVGVNSGGMDQSASILSTSSAALYISFYPKLSAIPAPLPPAAALVVAHSLVDSDKVVHAPRQYNLRVVETLAGARALARLLNVSVEHPDCLTLREMLGRWLGADNEEIEPPALISGLERLGVELENLRDELGGEAGASFDRMVELCGMSDHAFRELYLRMPVDAERFKLYTRTKHVISEALRVLRFQELCQASAAHSDEEHTLRTLGALMDASQSSCAHLFECSCPELDDLTATARKAGAFGSRLTGAGWGGCTVSLVPAHAVPSFLRRLRAFYPPYAELDDARYADAVFATKPSSGACLYKVTH